MQAVARSKWANGLEQADLALGIVKSLNTQNNGFGDLVHAMRKTLRR
jgi:hypothetical protein